MPRPSSPRIRWPWPRSGRRKARRACTWSISTAPSARRARRRSWPRSWRRWRPCASRSAAACATSQPSPPSPTPASRASWSGARSTPAPSRCRTRCVPPRAGPSMLAKRIIPCLDVKDGRVVKGVRFVDLRDAGDPVEAAIAYDAQGADELVFLDITASHEARDIMLDVVRRTAEGIYMPLTVGGGVRSIDDVRRLLRAGADKISLNTAALSRPAVIREAAERFGSQCIVVAIDAKRVTPTNVARPEPLRTSSRPPSVQAGLADPATTTWHVFTHGGRNTTGRDVVAWAQEAVALGA